MTTIFHGTFTANVSNGRMRRVFDRSILANIPFCGMTAVFNSTIRSHVTSGRMAPGFDRLTHTRE